MTEEEADILYEKFKSLARKYEKLRSGYRLSILSELLEECKLISLPVAKSGLFEEDLKRILGDD